MSASATHQPIAELGVDWYTTVLREGGHSEAAVSSVSIEALGYRGAVGDVERVRFTYDGVGRPGPASAVLKMRGSDELRQTIDAAMGLFDREARFYAELAHSVPVRTPCCYHVGDGRATPLLLEDLEGMRPGDLVEGLTLDDAQALLDALAELHAAYWESPLLAADWIVSPDTGTFAAMIGHVVASGVEVLQSRYADRVPADTIEQVSRLAPRWDAVLRRGAEGPRTLVHNDFRPDNAFFAADRTPVLIDWQTPARSRGTQDVGYLLVSGMDSEVLARHWESLVRRYHDGLRDRGVSGYSFDECVEHYRQNILYGLSGGLALLGSLDIGDERNLGDVILMRTLAHVAQLDSFATI